MFSNIVYCVACMGYVIIIIMASAGLTMVQVVHLNRGL